ncbi:MAG: nicotinate phosphoribosyltransferase [Patescibacteria group bacterium]
MNWIINSLLDTDFYKFTMGQLVFRKFRDVRVKYAFKNRTKDVNLTKFIREEDLRQELDHVRTLKFNRTEIKYIRGTNEYGDQMFGEDYIHFLERMELPPYQLAYKDGQLVLEFEGDWHSAIYWEIFALAIVNELYYKSLMSGLSKFDREIVGAKGQLRLAEKIKVLKENPDIVFTDFGTRRRFDHEWQDYVVETLAGEFPETQFRGTSNVALAMKHGLFPMGTSAHELFMVLAGIAGDADENVRRSHNDVLKHWWEMYGWGLSIALTDTFGSDFFFRDMTKNQAKEWKGLRQDSGDPVAFGEKAIGFYEVCGVDPRDKMIIFSDGLDIEAIVKLHKHFKGRIKTTFGWGTNLTNDLGFRALSLVVKTVEANSRSLVKLSDNLAKAIGKPEDVERYKRIFGYSGNNYLECRY